MKALVTTDPIKATELLRQAPQLSYAIFQALLLMNLVDTSVLTQVIENASPAAAAVAASSAAPGSSSASNVVNPYAASVAAYQPPATATPTPAPQAYAAITPAAPPPPPPPVVQQDPQRAVLIQQVLSLTPEQIGALPADQQNQIMMLKHQLSAAGGF
jgi:cleavage stimulation factor subunit 2